MNNKILNGKSAIITGGSNGLGADIAMTLARAGANVAIIGRDINSLKRMKKKIEQTSQECLEIQADFQCTKQIQQAAEKILSHHPHWDILVNNLGITKKVPLLETEIEDWDLIQNVNLRSVFLFSKLIVPQMIKQRYGKIINISSMGTFYGTPGLAAYNVSKAGINQLTKTMAIEWGSYNLQINAVCPSIVLTEMGKSVWNDPQNEEVSQYVKKRIPLKRFAEPSEISELVLFLAGSGSNFINGTIIPVDDGARYNPF